MDISSIASLITSVGFPIVMCLLMYKYITEDSKQTREVMASLETAVKSLEKTIESLLEKGQKGGNNEN